MSQLQGRKAARRFVRLMRITLQDGSRRVSSGRQAGDPGGRQGAGWTVPTTGLPFVAGLSEAYGDWTL
jgi:hypothetical protein